MAKKPNPLNAALSAVSSQDHAPAPAPTKTREATAVNPEPKATRRARPDREAKVLIGGHFPKPVRQQLRMIAAEEDTTTQALLEEALDLLFVKKGKGKIL